MEKIENELNQIVEIISYRKVQQSNELAMLMFNFFEEAVKTDQWWEDPESLR